MLRPHILLCTLRNLFILKIETGFAFKPHMNDVYVKSFDDQTFNQDSDESAILKIK